MTDIVENMVSDKDLENLGIRAIKDHVLVTDMNFDQRITTGGIILLADDRRQEGIRPRWARVIAVGKDEKNIKPGQYILVDHGRWTRGVEYKDMVIRRVDNNDILLVSDEPKQDENFGIMGGEYYGRERV